MKKDAVLEGHIIICGLGHVGYRIAELLHHIGETFVVITREIRPEWRSIIEERAVQFILGDARVASCLGAAGIATAKAVIVATDHDLTNIEISLDVQRIYPSVPIVVRVFDRFLADRATKEMRVRSVLSPALLTAPVFVAAAQGDEMTRAFEISGSRINVFQLEVRPDAREKGVSLEEFCTRRKLLPIRLTCSDGSAGAIDPGQPLAAGDRITVAASGPSTDRLRREGLLPRRMTRSERNHPIRRLARALRHPLYPFRTVFRVWKNASGSLKFAFIALHLLFLISIVVFHYDLPKRTSWIDSIYFTVTMMTTVGFGDYSLHDASPWIKLYGCLVMVAGAALVAIVFSLITDYIVSARVDQALGRRTSTLEDHVVVVGLGDVGTRVAEELHRVGEGVIAIERDADHESVPVLQDHMQVIIGDANRESAMKQANFSQARAIIVTTTDDLTSLRIAHQAELFNPKLRTVVRIYDSALAHKLGSGLAIGRAVNAAQTAAATFVASALTENVEHGFVLDDRLFALRPVTVESANIPETPLELVEYDCPTRSWVAPGCRWVGG